MKMTSQPSQRRRALIPALLLALFGSLGTLLAQTNLPPGFPWAIKVGGSSTDLGVGVAVDTNGNIYVTGGFSGTASFGATNLTSYGGRDIFVVKYDDQRNLLWARKAGSGADDDGRSIAVDSAGNVFVIGYFQSTATFGPTNVLSANGSSDIFVAKYNNGGDLVWAIKAGGGQDDNGYGVALDAAGNAYVTGGFKVQATFGTFILNDSGSPEDLFVAKCDSSGNFLWVQRVSAGFYSEGRGIAVDATGSVFVTGMVGSNPTSMCVAKYDSFGSPAWLTVVPRVGGEETGWKIAADGLGNCYATGAQTAKYNSAGNEVWRNSNAGYGIAVTTLRHVLVAGDQTLREYDPAGSPLWSQPISAIGRGWAIRPGGQSIVIGDFSGTAVFGTNSLVSAGGTDVFIAAVTTSEAGILVGPTNQAAQLGSNATFAVFVSGSPPFYYQWFFNSTNSLVGQTNATLPLTGLTFAQMGSYSVLVSNNFSSILSSNAFLTVLDTDDDDHDGIANWWEVRYGLNPTNAFDATTYPAGDQLTFLQKFQNGLDPTKLDYDGDGLSDYDELFAYGTNPSQTDTDGDGMLDGWEIQHGLNARFNDAGDDLDGDGLSNLAEYNWSLSHTNQLLDPRTKYSINATTSDYAVVNGAGTNQFFYDRNNRLIGAEFDRGLALAYVYDGNDNLVRQVSMKHDANTNGLPDVWEFLNGLTNNASAYTDTDGDGWTDYQEWKAGTKPRDPQSTPNLLGNPGTQIASLQLPFTPSNFVAGVGQLDGLGAEEIVIGADGNSGANVNFLLVLTQGATTWSTQRVDVGAFGITSLAVGQLTNRPIAGIYVGLRGTTNGSGRVMEFTSNGSLWQSNVVALSTNQTAYVLGVRGPDVLVSLATTNAPDGSLSAVNFTTNWSLLLMDTNASHRGLGTLLQPQTISAGALRLLDSGGVALGQVTVASAQGLAGYWSFDDGTAKDNSGNGNDGTLQGALPTSGIIGGALSFDGVGSRVQMVPSASLNLRNALTIVAWIKPSANALDPRGTIVRNGIGSDELYSLFYVPPGRIGFEWSGGGVEWNTFYAPTNVISADRWSHVAATRDDSQFIRLYVNGQEVANVQGTTSTSLTPGWFTIGSTQPGTTVQDFGGIIDEVRVFNRALNSAELAVFSTSSAVLPEPAATRTNNWRGTSLASGFLRGTNGSSIFYTFADDKNGNGVIDFADDFVTAEYLVSGTNASLLTTNRQPIASLTPAQSYGLASVNFLNASNEVFFTGEPDGQVFAWTATGATNPLQRQLFSAHHSGKAWHALTGVKTLEPGEGLIGLRVDPVSPNKCDVIFWSPQSQLPQLASLPNTAPAAALLPSTNTLGSLALVTVRLWDAEGNASTPFLQYQLSGSTNWLSATLLNLDGGTYSASTRVAALTGGVNHTVLWNVQADVGANVVTNILLRARASDFALLGDWSAGTPFALNTALADNDGMDDSWELLYFGTTSRPGTGDFDSDGFTDYQEYIADTNPTNAASYLRITAITPLPTAVKIDWLGGSNATQYVQRTLSLSVGNTWSNLITNLPPTTITGSYTDTLGTNVMKFYRIEVTR